MTGDFEVGNLGMTWESGIEWGVWNTKWNSESGKGNLERGIWNTH